MKVKADRFYLSHFCFAGNKLYMYLGTLLMISVGFAMHSLPYVDDIFNQITAIDREFMGIPRIKQKFDKLKRNQIHFEMVCAVLFIICLIICVAFENYTYPP